MTKGGRVLRKGKREGKTHQIGKEKTYRLAGKRVVPFRGGGVCPGNRGECNLRRIFPPKKEKNLNASVDRGGEN